MRRILSLLKEYRKERLGAANASPQRLAEVDDLYRVFDNLLSGLMLNSTGGFDGPETKLGEVMTSADFSNAFSDFVQRQMWPAYTEKRFEFEQFVKPDTAPNFQSVTRKQNRAGVDDLEYVPEKGEARPGSVSDAVNRSYRVYKWEKQFDLRDTGLTEQERRDRLAATWKALGGQDPKYIQDTLQANGFNVFLHEWWEPGTEPAPGVKQCATPRNPIMYLRREFTGATLMVDCGEPLAACGEAFAEAGNGVEPRGYPLVNKVFETTADILPLCGEAVAEAGEVGAQCGDFIEFKETLRQYIVPSDPDKWPYFLYIGGETFGTIAQVDPKRRDEFEALCLKICPTQQWLGILVEYI